MNPYASFLGDRNAVEVISTTARRLHDLVTSLGANDLDRPIAPGKWNPRQILCHLADTEIAFSFRLRQAKAEPNHVIQPFDQDLWAQSYSCSAYDAFSALEAFTALRIWNQKFVTHLTPEDLAKPVSHPERGPMTLQVILETMAGHDTNHLRQIEAAAGRAPVK